MTSKDCTYYYIPLSLALKFEKLAALRGVSKVARGETKSTQTTGGFFQVAKTLNGSISKLKKKKINAQSDQSWWTRRNNFCERHCAQQKLQKTPLVEKSGKYKGTPSRRQLGMIMWLGSNLSPQQLKAMLPLIKNLTK